MMPWVGDRPPGGDLVKLAIFDDYRLGVVSADETTLVDVTDTLP